ncbi:unnamed protein product [Boreogadus saida]
MTGQLTQGGGGGGGGGGFSMLKLKLGNHFLDAERTCDQSHVRGTGSSAGSWGTSLSGLPCFLSWSAGGGDLYRAAPPPPPPLRRSELRAQQVIGRQTDTQLACQCNQTTRRTDRQADSQPITARPSSSRHSSINVFLLCSGENRVSVSTVALLPPF